MNYPSLTNDDIRKATSREDLIRETAEQIIKDFAEFDLVIHFSGNVYDFYQELFGQMQQHVDILLASQGEKFFNLLYRIDVDPKDIDHYQQQFPETSHVDVVTELIIHRELKKVMIREYFRQSK
ncbi:hypothetical protein [Marinilabilia rubra]|uniref:Uncharacterized protein n=1 Tax=Marinilabilia rubra TaxID=2162893 RepID=A0A2U2B7Z9_9BACT|nr:hypothetical protein [Marinilabilia rubra]PWD99190.1 hypothetical protein DDZ16_11370 [Marinilabilia rubra]